MKKYQTIPQKYIKENNYKLLDCQVHNDHLEKLGAFEISRETFMKVLKVF